jgi:N-acetyl-anhydromuramyl-L-alanine amidase AmpD
MININPDINKKTNSRTITHLVVHCTAGSQTETIDDILRFFRIERGWQNPGYHYIVKPDGDVVNIFPETLVSNGVKGHNQHSIHISWMGGVDAKINPIDNRTPHQKNALRVALKILKGKYPDATILGHRDFSPDLNHDGIIEPAEWMKTCPNFDAIKEYADIK